MLTGVVVFLLLLIGLLAIPVALSFQLSRRQTFQGNVTLLWLFGLVRVNIPLFQPKTMVPRTKESEQKRKKNQTIASSGKKPNAFVLIRNKRFRRRIMRFLGDFWHAIHKENISLRMRIGLGDPADTGQVWAIVGPLAGVLSSIQGARIEIEPEFIAPCFELDSSGNIRLHPLQMLFLVLGLMLSPTFWQGMKQMRAMG